MTTRATGTVESPAIAIRDKMIQLLDDNRMTDTALKQLNISNVLKNAPDDVRNPVLYINFLGKIKSKPTELGRQNVTYSDDYGYNLLYIESRFDRDVADQLAKAIDILTDFFERHSGLDGLCTMGLSVDDGLVTNYMDDKNIYLASSITITVPYLKRRNRNL